MNWLKRLFGWRDPRKAGTIRFDVTGWQLCDTLPERTVWQDADGDVLSVDRVGWPSDLPLGDLASLRSRCRKLAEASNAGLVSADVVPVADSRAVELIYKREQRPAYAYTGMLILPTPDVEFVVVVACVERGVTGMRDALVTAQLAQEGKLELEELEQPTAPGGPSGKIKGWFRDPYNPAYGGPFVLCSEADDEKWDALLPAHPLTKVRRTLRTIRDSIHLEARVTT